VRQKSLGMANHVRYIRRRSNGVYYYERRVPQAVIDQPHQWQTYFDRSSLFRKSLRTKSQVEALDVAKRVHDEFHRLVSAAVRTQVVASSPADNATREVTPELLSKITNSTRERLARPWAQAIVLAENGRADQEYLDEMKTQREWDAESLRPILLELLTLDDPRIPDIANEVDRLVERERLDASPQSNMRALIARAVRDGHIQAQREIDAMLEGKSSAIPPDRLRPGKAIVPKISEVMTDYISRLEKPRTIREAQGALKSFVDVIGDLPLDEITRAEVVRFCRIEGSRAIGGNSPGSIARAVSPETLKKKVGLLRAAINHAIETDQYVGANPAAKIDARRFTKPVRKAVMPSKRPFTVHELQLLLQHPWFTGCESATKTYQPGTYRLKGMHYWVPILAMYTGCRAGELGGLRISEVRIDHQHPHIVIQDNQYRTTKGSYRRNIPLLDVILNHGFGEFVEGIAGAGHDRLFHDWKPPAGQGNVSEAAWSNGSLIRAFNRTVVRHQLRTILNEGVRQEVTFHGFRGAFKTLLGRPEYGLPANYIHEVIGHAKSELDKRYIQEIPLADTYPAMRHCTYDGLVLPLAP